MFSNERITQAYWRLLAKYGTEKQQAAARRAETLADLPDEADLIDQAIDQAARDPEASTTYLRAALELAGLDQYKAETREVNVVAMLKNRGVSWKEIAAHRGLGSAQAAEQRYKRLSQAPEVLIFAFRDADEKDASWHGEPYALGEGQFETGYLDFNPAQERPFSRHRLELRYGPVDAEVMPAYLRAYALVNGRRIAATAAVQLELFGG